MLCGAPGAAGTPGTPGETSRGTGGSITVPSTPAVQGTVLELLESREDLGADGTFTTVASVRADGRHWLVERRGGDAELVEEELTPLGLEAISRAVRDPELQALGSPLDLRANALVVEPHRCRFVLGHRSLEVIGDLARDVGARRRAPKALLELFDRVRTTIAAPSPCEPGAWVVELVPCDRVSASLMPLFAPECEEPLAWPIGLTPPRADAALRTNAAPLRARYENPGPQAGTKAGMKAWLELRRAAGQRRPVVLRERGEPVQTEGRLGGAQLGGGVYTVILSPQLPQSETSPAGGHDSHPSHSGF